ncbi:DUF4118 domain-containing protein, partial [Actinotalea sp. C106]|uniref:DUF4118 domain-containing protein n=1 Tax=Actinotalea sp. C106 TaxID=2908644 RepID=UPI00202782A0
RLIAGWVLAVVGPPALAAGLLAVHRLDALPTVLMLFLALTVGVAITGGLRPALLAAVGSGLLSNYFFTPPVRTWTVAEPQNAVAILVLLAVAVAVSGVVDLAARRTHEAVRARREADALTTIARGVLRGGDVVPTLLEHLREALRMDAVVLEEREDSVDRWCTTSRADDAVAGGAGEGPRDGAGEHVLPVSEHLRLRLRGRSLAAP